MKWIHPTGNLYDIFAKAAERECHYYDDDPFFARVLLFLAVFWHYIFSVGIFAIGLFKHDIVLVAFGVALWFDYILNTIVRMTIAQKSPSILCGSEYEMPAYVSQHISLTIVIVLTFAVMYRSRIGILTCAYITSFSFIVLYSRIYVGANDNMQLVVGSLFGTLNGVLFILLYYLIVQKHIKYLTQTWICKRLGFTSTLSPWDS